MVDRFEEFSRAIHEISRYWHRLAAEELAKYGLKGPHATYLTILHAHPDGITMPQLCEVSGRDKSDASRMVAILEEKGLVTRESVDGKRYRGTLQLTGQGKIAAAQVAKRASRAVEVAGKDLTDSERAIFYKSLESIRSNLCELSEEGIPE